MGGLEMAPQAPQRSERPGAAVTLLGIGVNGPPPLGAARRSLTLLGAPQRSERPGAV